MFCPDLSGLVFDASQHESIIKPQGDFWVFAYGSLMWNPEFAYLESDVGRLFGYHRRLCLWSVEYRGCLKQPGLVMGLDSGGSCVGRAFLIAEENAQQTIDMLNEREMITGAYRSELKTVHLKLGKKIQAVCLIARHDHPQYASKLDESEIINIVSQAKGARGLNRDYVVNTANHMREMGLFDRSLERISGKLKLAIT